MRNGESAFVSGPKWRINLSEATALLTKLKLNDNNIRINDEIIKHRCEIEMNGEHQRGELNKLICAIVVLTQP